jgi:hypothetical protein
MAHVFEHCGRKMQGFFDPSGPMSTETRAMPKFGEECVESSDGEDELGFNLVNDQS